MNLVAFPSSRPSVASWPTWKAPFPISWQSSGRVSARKSRRGSMISRRRAKRPVPPPYAWIASWPRQKLIWPAYHNVRKPSDLQMIGSNSFCAQCRRRLGAFAAQSTGCRASSLHNSRPSRATTTWPQPWHRWKAVSRRSSRTYRLSFVARRTAAPTPSASCSPSNSAI